MEIGQIHAMVRARAGDVPIHCISSGDPNAHIAVVSDYPGEVEKRTMVPFTGASGVYLWRGMAHNNIPRTMLYVTNIIKSAIYGETDKEADDRLIEAKKHIDLWTLILNEELRCLPNLQYLLILGSLPLRHLIASRHLITNMRGSVVDREGKRAFITYNPAYVIRKLAGVLAQPTLEVIFRADLAKFARMIKLNPSEPPIQCRVARTVGDVREVIASMSPDRPMVVDIEHIRKQTACVGLCNDDKVGHVIPFTSLREEVWTEGEELEIRTMLSELLASHPMIVGQNINTDAYWLHYKDRIKIQKIWFDTLLAHHLLYSTIPHSLAFLVSQYTWHPYYKSEGQEWAEKGDIEQYWEYNAKDTVLTRRVYGFLVKELEGRNLTDFFYHHVMRSLAPLPEATAIGIEVDDEVRMRVDAELGKEVRKLKVKTRLQLYQLTSDRHVNINSTQQLAKLFIDDMKLPSRGRSVDKHKLNSWLVSPRVSDEAKAVVGLIQEYRKKAKFLNTYVRVGVDDD